MPTLRPRHLKYALSALIIVVVGVLMYVGTISAEAGLAVIVGVAAGVGIYQTAHKAGESQQKDK